MENEPKREYKILWLDDAFVIEDAERMSQRRDMDDKAEEAKESGFIVDPVGNLHDFSDQLQKSPYQAVILDIAGLDPEDPTDKGNATLEAIRCVEKYNGILIYIFSGSPKSDQVTYKEFVKHPRIKGERIFDKEHFEELLTKIREDLDNQLHFYAGHEECLNLLNKGYLIANEKMGCIVQKESDPEYFPYNEMRQVLEDMLKTLSDKEYIPKYIRTNNQRMDYLTKKCNIKEDSKGNLLTDKNGGFIIDFDNPKVPFGDCSPEIKCTLGFLWDITNRYSHFLENHQEFLLQGEALSEYGALIKQATYSAFYAAMKWYHGYMTTKFGK